MSKHVSTCLQVQAYLNPDVDPRMDPHVDQHEIPAALEEHLAACERCAALAVRQLDIHQALPAADLDQLLAGVELRIDQEHGLRAWLRSRATWQRACITGVCIAVLLMLSRSVGAATNTLSVHTLVELVIYGTVLSLAALELLRPTHWVERVGVQHVLGFSALALPFIVPWLSTLFRREHLEPSRGGCLIIGTLMGLGTLAVLRAVDRSAHATQSLALLAAAAAGLVGNLALALYCPGNGVWHLLLCHAPVGIVLLALYAQARRRRLTSSV